MLATLADVASELGLESDTDLTDAQTAKATSLLVKASYLFRQAADRQFTPGTYAHRLQVVGGRVRLPESPVTAVDSVTDDCGNTVSYTRNGAWLTIAASARNWSNTFDCYQPSDSGSGWFVTATYTGGEIPDVVRVTVAQLVARYLNVDTAPATGVKAQTLTAGPFTTQTQFADWAAESMCLSDDDRLLAESFRHRGPQPIVQRP